MQNPRANQFIPTRQSLLSRLQDWTDNTSWKQFFDAYWKLIYLTATHAGLDDTEAQEVVQETVISVSKAMPGFRYDAEKGSFKGWLLQLTRWRITDQLRKRSSPYERLRSPPDQTRLEELADPRDDFLESVWDEHWKQNLLDAAIERVKAKVNPKQFQIYDLLALQDWPVTKVARTFKVTVGGVYLIKHRLTKLIKREVAHLEEKLF